MQTITVTHPSGSYPIILGEGALSQTGPRLAELGYKGRCALITNEVVGPRHDPCVGVRAGVTLESRLAIELLNAVLMHQVQRVDLENFRLF